MEGRTAMEQLRHEIKLMSDVLYDQHCEIKDIMGLIELLNERLELVEKENRELKNRINIPWWKRIGKK